MRSAELETPAGAPARVRSVTRPEDLEALAGSWDELHAADPHATVFASRPWLGARLAGLAAGSWWLLAAGPDDDGRLDGLLALRRLRPDEPGGPEDGPEEPGGARLTFAGSSLADYTGSICRPGREGAVAAAFADHLARRLAWRRLEIRDALDPRLGLLLERLRALGCRVERRPPTPCPRLELEAGWAGDWDAYLAARVGRRRRETIRRKLRAIEALPGFRRTRAEDEGEGQVDVVLDLWRRRWGPLAPARRAEHRRVLVSCLAAGRLWGDVLWDGEVPIAGLLALVEPERGAFRFYVSGFDERYAALSPGLAIVAHSVREALRAGYRTYDFLRGDEPYKLSFGARPGFAENVRVERAAPEV